MATIIVTPTKTCEQTIIRIPETHDQFTIKIPRIDGKLGLSLAALKARVNPTEGATRDSKKQKTHAGDNVRYDMIIQTISPAFKIANRIRNMLVTYYTDGYCKMKYPTMKWNSLDDIVNLDKGIVKTLFDPKEQEAFNHEIIKFALVYGVKGNDMIHRIETPREVISVDDFKGQNPIAQVSAILSNTTNYPLRITFKRNVYDVPLRSGNGPIPYALPDILPRFNCNDLVQTRMGPGVIVSTRIDRHTQGDNLVHPILIYTIRHISHMSYVPSSEVMSFQHPDVQVQVLKYLNFSHFFQRKNGQGQTHVDREINNVG